MQLGPFRRYEEAQLVQAEALVQPWQGSTQERQSPVLL